MSMRKFLKIIMARLETVDEDIISNDLIFDIDWQGTKQLSQLII